MLQGKLLPRLLLGVILWSAAAGAAPVNPGATPEARAVFDYLRELTENPALGVLSGQNCGHGPEILQSYERSIAALARQSGKWVAIAGLDYEFMRRYSAEELARANDILIAHWRAGGLVTINVTPQCPFAPDGNVFNKTGNDLDKLLDPATPQGRLWKESLDRWAAALAQLRDAGVVVLWRPMQEMNGTHPQAFWYSRAYNSPESFQRLWRHMHRYFTGEKRLDNLLWVYSELGGGCTAETNPGPEFFDIVAPTAYSDQLKLWKYAQCVQYCRQHGKALGWAEMGHNYDKATGDFDMTRYAQSLTREHPRVAYWVCWQSWGKSKMAIVDNRNAKELMNDPGVITREAVAWRKHLKPQR